MPTSANGPLNYFMTHNSDTAEDMSLCGFAMTRDGTVAGSSVHSQNALLGTALESKRVVWPGNSAGLAKMQTKLDLRKFVTGTMQTVI